MSAALAAKRTVKRCRIADPPLENDRWFSHNTPPRPAVMACPLVPLDASEQRKPIVSATS
jgi:hypothetical protein